MYAIFDRCSGVYDRPFPSRADAEALRSFSQIANDSSHPIGQSPEDFTLFNIGTYDDNDGDLSGSAPVKVANGAEVLERGKSDA
jgi:hypothetical protein